MEDPVITKIKKNFDIQGSPAKIPLMTGKKFFTARLEEDGIYVDNLGNQPFLPWEAFSEAINCLKENGGQVRKGNATDSRLGDSNLDLKSMEGYIASKVYGYKIGDSVFKRITPIASILAWAEICENARGQIRLLLGKEEFPEFGKGEKVPLAHNKGESKENSKMSPVPMTFDSRDIDMRKLETQSGQRDEAIKIFEAAIQEKDLEVRTLQDKVKAQLAEIERYESELSEKDKDLRILAEKFITADSEIRKIEEKLVGRERKINNLEVALATSEEKIKKLEKQFSEFKGEENLAVQLREKEEQIRQLKGTLASKEEEFSRLNEENRKYKRQQKFESEGLKQIDEQKASKRWWKHW